MMRRQDERLESETESGTLIPNLLKEPITKAISQLNGVGETLRNAFMGREVGWRVLTRMFGVGVGYGKER